MSTGSAGRAGVAHRETVRRRRTHPPSSVASYFVKQRVDTVIVTGRVTSGCIRASVSDSFSHRIRTIVPEVRVGDYDESPHQDNLRDMSRRYAGVSDADACIEYIVDRRRRNAA